MQRLLKNQPDPKKNSERMLGKDRALLEVRSLIKHFDVSGGFLNQLKWQKWRPVRKRTVLEAVNGVSFAVYRGETLGLVGESGCGKSTVGRLILGLYTLDDGEIYYNDNRVDNQTGKNMLQYRTRMQMIFQDPYASLNPRMIVRKALEEPLIYHYKSITRAEVREKVAVVMKQVGVDEKWADRYPHEFSGGQRQRISIARALMVDPEFIVADEPISALDVSIQAQILNLLMDSQKERNIAYLFISHDLSVVRHVSARIAVMYLGTLCEVAPAEDFFARPQHPYSLSLLSAIPKLGRPMPKRIKMLGEVPTPIDLPKGCVFQMRCPYVQPICQRDRPELVELEKNHYVACFLLSGNSKISM